MTDMLKDMAFDPRKAVQSSNKAKKMDDSGCTEIDVIEGCIGRFGGLLKVGFGEAGMRIISRNLVAEEFNPVIPGHIVRAVFGFCDIRNFTDCCEVLKKDTMIFTNSIAAIVHNLVEESGGCVNKNIGDAFLAVWKLKEEEVDDETAALTRNMSSASDHPSTPKVTLRQRYYSHHLTGAGDICDGCLHSFLKMNALMKTSEDIQKLSADRRLQKKLPGYTVRMGSGLHLGWAIEGAVGSSHKVDATYLSPHVNMASRLEAATKQYGVNILMSDSLVEAFSNQLVNECRPIDRVTMKGSSDPITLYVHMPSETMELTDEQRRKFVDLWTKAFDLYQNGSDWLMAAKLMSSCLDILPRDGPAKVLLEFMKEMGGVAPAGWPGYRALTSK
jgi:class 3 adenylate cyclase